MNRRRVLAGAAAGTAGLAGCLTGFPAGEEPSYHREITVQNDHDEAYDVRAELVDAEERVVFEWADEVRPGEGRGVSDDVPAGQYTLTLDLDERSRMRSYWNTDHCDVHLVRTDVAADGHVSQHVTCRDQEAGPGPFDDGDGGGPPTEDG